MKKSNLQFSNPVLTRLEFEIHKSFKADGPIEMPINIKREIVRNADGDVPINMAQVAVTLSVGNKDSSTPFYIEADEEAKFKWNEGMFNEVQIEDLLKLNATALLLSYLRPVISNITSSSPYPAYNLPYLDLTANEEE